MRPTKYPYGNAATSVPDPDPPGPHVCVLQDPDPDPLVRGMDTDPSIILLSPNKNSKKNLDSYCFVTSFGLFIFEK
jgi:hypothetical protein